jgi:hypothetical protein
MVENLPLDDVRHRIIGIGGMPGTGKTTYRKENYPDTPFVDVADIYQKHRGTIKPLDAWKILVLDMKRHFDDGVSLVVVEASFTKKQTEIIYALADMFGYSVEIIRMADVSTAEAIRRVKNEQALRSHEDPYWWRIYTAYRLRIITHWGQEDLNNAELDEHAGVFQPLRIKRTRRSR